MHLEKVVTKKRSLHVIEQLVRMIKDGHYGVGAKLPPERVITEETGVGRSSVREALAVLQASGVIEIKVGDGIYVKSTSFNDLNVPPSIKNPAEVLELRMCLESKVAALAARRRTDAQLASLWKLCASMREVAADGDVERFKELDQRFHNLVASFADNEAIQEQVETLVAHLYQPIWLILQRIYFSGKDLGGIEDSIREHDRLVSAIERQDASEAETAMWDHLARVHSRLVGQGESRGGS